MKTIARLATIFCSINLFTLPVFADPKIIYAASLTDGNGLRAESSMKLQMQASESDYRLVEWYISHGVTRNVIDSAPLEPKIKNFQSVFVGRSHVSKKK